MDKRWTTDGVTTEEKGRETVLSGVSEDFFTGNNLLTIYFPKKNNFLSAHAIRNDIFFPSCDFF